MWSGERKMVIKEQKVGSFVDGVDLADKVREVVKAKVEAGTKDNVVIKALVDGDFENVKPEDELELTKEAARVNKIRTSVFVETLRGASSEDLAKLGLDESTRDLVVGLLEVGLSADPLFIKFLEFAKATPTPPKEATMEAIYSLGSEGAVTIRTLFPEETKTLAEGFAKLAVQGGDWVQKPGGAEFQKALTALSGYFNEVDPQKMGKLREEFERYSLVYLREGFPLFITVAVDELIRPPYSDPEVKVAVRTPDAMAEEENWRRDKEALAASLNMVGAEDQATSVLDQTVVGLITAGRFGMNLMFNAVAQENPTTMMFLDAQLWSHDRQFPSWMKRFMADSDKVFAPSEETRELLEFMARMNTVNHELSHWVFKIGSAEAEKFGNGAENRTMREVKAEMVYRALIPKLIEQGVLPGTKERWAMALTTSSLEFLSRSKNQPNDLDYFLGAAYSLNDLLEQGVLIFDNSKLKMIGVDKYFEIVKVQVQEIVALHRDPNAKEVVAREWIERRCRPNEYVREILKLL